MTQAQLDLQNQLEQTNNTGLTHQLLFNVSPVLFRDAMDQDPSVAMSEQNLSSTEQIEHQTPPEKHQTPPKTNTFEQSHGTPPPPKKRYEIMEDPAFLSLPIHPPVLTFKPHSLSTNREEHLIPLLSHDYCTFKQPLISLYMHPTD